MDLGDSIISFVLIDIGIMLLALTLGTLWIAPRLLGRILCALGHHKWNDWRRTQRPLIDIRDCTRSQCAHVQLRYTPIPQDEVDG